MITTLILITKTFLLSHLIVKYEPITWIMESIRDSFNKNGLTRLLYNIISLSLGCIKCCSLYIGWILGGFWIGVISTFITYLYSNLISPKIEKLRFN